MLCCVVVGVSLFSSLYFFCSCSSLSLWFSWLLVSYFYRFLLPSSLPSFFPFCLSLSLYLISSFISSSSSVCLLVFTSIITFLSLILHYFIYFHSFIYLLIFTFTFQSYLVLNLHFFKLFLSLNGHESFPIISLPLRSPLYGSAMLETESLA